MAGKVKYVTNIGDVFGELTVEEILSGVSNAVVCRCSCGSRVQTGRSALHNGLTRRCSKCRNNKLAELWRAPDGHAAKTEIYNDYAYGARKRSIEWLLTKETFFPLIDMNCHYCGAAPATEKKTSRIKYGTYVYNGVDRIDSSGPYSIDNCVPCCKICNYMKGSLTKKEFISMCRKVTEKAWSQSQ